MEKIKTRPGKHMKALLVSPRGKISSHDKFVKFWYNNPVSKQPSEMYTGISLGLLTLASLMKDDFEVEFVDENKTNIDFNKDYDLVAISCMTQQAPRAYEIAKKFRSKKITVIIGGIHPTVMSEEAKLHADSVFTGEAEGVWNDFKADFLKGDIKPFYHNKSLVDLKNSPIPSYELLKPEDYKVVWIQTTRGCPHKCEFCVASNIFGSKYRHKEINQVIEEIKKIKSVWNRPVRLNFADDNMFVDRKYSKELLKAMVPLGMRWLGQTDISVAFDDKLLEMIKKSGCAVLLIGFESLTNTGLRFIDKTNWKAGYLKDYSKAVKNIQAHDIGVMGSFITGLDTDTKNSFNKIADFIIKNHLCSSHISVLTPFPGTPLRQRMESEKRLLNCNWDKYTIWDAVYKPKNMTKKELEDGWAGIYNKIYRKEVQLSNLNYFRKMHLASPRDHGK